MVGRPISEMVIFPALYKGFWKAMYQMKACFFLYLMIHDMMQNYLNCENGEFKIDFSTFIF